MLRTAWKNYVSAGEDGYNLNAAYICLQLFDRVTQQFVFNQI